MTMVKKVGLIGGGVIGAGWAARFLTEGVDVALFDPDPEIGRKMGEVLANARRARLRLYPDGPVTEGRLTLAGSVEEAVTDADFVQESLPERLDLKQRVLAAASRAMRPDAILGSSTSGLLPTELQRDMVGPERLVVGHPFNPVYLLPLVEVCGGAKTDPAVMTRAAEIYRSVGMKPLLLKREIDGFVADRLLEALWREALWLVHDGIATTEEVDDAIRYGAGLRWSFMGTFLIYRIAGGEAGMRHFMAQFGPALKWPWSKLTDVPELTEEFLDRLAAQSDDQAAGRSIRELERLRDDCLVSVLRGLSAADFGAGSVIRAHQDRIWDRATAVASAAPAASADGMLRLHRAEVSEDWIDYNGHMTESRYLHVLGNATDAFLRHIGVDTAYVAAGLSYYTVESHIMHTGQARAGDMIAVETQLISHDQKRLHLFHRLLDASTGAELASGEHMLLHVDSKASRATPAGPEMLGRLEEIAAAQAGLERPAVIGRHVGAPRR